MEIGQRAEKSKLGIDPLMALVIEAIRSHRLERTKHGAPKTNRLNLMTALYDPQSVGGPFAAYMAQNHLAPQEIHVLCIRMTLEQSGFLTVPKYLLREAIRMVDHCGLYNAARTERDISDLLGSAA